MTLKDYLNDGYYYYSGKLGEISRYIAFSGIAVVWIFATKLNDGSTYTLPKGLFLPLLLLIVSLALDLLQYLFMTIATHCFFVRKEKEAKKKNINAEKFEVKSPKWIPRGGAVFLYFKVGFNIIAFVILIIRLSKLII